MSHEVSEVYRCADRIQAETIRIRLAAAGVTAFVEGDDAVSSMAMSGGGVNEAIVRVEVASEDFEQAMQILQQDQVQRLTQDSWVCDRCGETNDASFDVCWQCRSPRDELNPPTPEVDS
ncbi:hypothetical protein CA13_24780 [Planctomycetes bacterium CA13]|uniref:RanBP2-type domain-containing protein n=1 Tax=Novipirellula herctigrandis TaxID=2527986 RepID=A0A5C5Z2G2_9BACT|nr:hypothetical protein CA13_24780 [Planctomycetes bacterium CA13]